VLVVSDDRTSRRRIERHAAVFDAAFPGRGHQARALIRDPAAHPAVRGGRATMSAPLFLPSVHRVNANAGRGGHHRIRGANRGSTANTLGSPDPAGSRRESARVARGAASSR
jgi:hypothetical protein